METDALLILALTFMIWFCLAPLIAMLLHARQGVGMRAMRAANRRARGFPNSHTSTREIHAD